MPRKRSVRERAERRAAAYEIPYEEAEAFERRAAARKAAQDRLEKQKAHMEARIRKREREAEREILYPKGKSVRAIPTAFERNRRRH
jgi:hypothetical protein